ncbi:MAG: hypothetical protein HFJ02_04760 [Bacilli bacterium]|nr:hypothetical protein [Bacilli bacterium]
MKNLDTNELIYERIKNRPTIWNLKKDYDSFGKVGENIIQMINLFDDLDSHDTIAYDKMNEFYRYIKEITPYFCHSEPSVQLLRNLAEEKKWIEVKFSDNSIIDEIPLYVYDGHKHNYDLNKYSSMEEILNEIVYQTRTMLTGLDHDYNKLLNFNLVNRCQEASEFIAKLVRNFDIQTKIIKISAAFSDNELLYGIDMNYHYFVIIIIDNIYYLIDCTYSQFFSWYQNYIERLGNYCYSGCCPGVYMLKDIEREKVARIILRNGWIKLDEATFKHYLDGFTLFYRNGLYYEDLGEAIYTTDYTIDTYINFLFGDDSQIKHETKRVLGYQPSPLRKSDFKF